MWTGDVSVRFLLVECRFEVGFDGRRPPREIKDWLTPYYTFRETRPDEDEFYC